MRVVLLFVLLLFVPVASGGEWRGEGTPLYVVAEGRVHGGVFVGGGHGYTHENPYEEYFDLPSRIEYARLYVPMWNYNRDDWLEVSINNRTLGRRSLPDYLAAWGVACYVYNVTGMLSEGVNRVSVRYHNLNGAPYGIVLVAVYRNSSMPQTEFWIAEGNQALARQTRDSTSVVFNATSLEIKNATLWTVLIAGNKGEEDRLYFNSQLLGEDVGRAKSGAYFDLDRWDVTGLVGLNNTLRFERGEEAYIHPFNAVLAVEYLYDQGEDYLRLGGQVGPGRATVPMPVIVVLVASVVFFFYRLRRRR